MLPYSRFTLFLRRTCFFFYQTKYLQSFFFIILLIILIKCNHRILKNKGLIVIIPKVFSKKILVTNCLISNNVIKVAVTMQSKRYFLF